jgi:hypothetical protein
MPSTEGETSNCNSVTNKRDRCFLPRQRFLRRPATAGLPVQAPCYKIHEAEYLRRRRKEEHPAPIL